MDRTTKKPYLVINGQVCTICSMSLYSQRPNERSPIMLIMRRYIQTQVLLYLGDILLVISVCMKL